MRIEPGRFGAVFFGATMIVLTSNTVASNAPVGTKIGTLTLFDDTGLARGYEWMLTKGAAGYFICYGLAQRRAPNP
jgi:hypothetical protein